MLFAPKEQGQGLVGFVMLLAVCIIIVVWGIAEVNSIKETGRFSKNF